MTNVPGLLALLLLTCAIPAPAPDTYLAPPSPPNGSRLAWDYSTLRKVAPLPGGVTVGYNGYARMIQRADGTLLCVYEAAGSVELVGSRDEGQTWAGRTVVAPREPGLNMAVPELTELRDGTLLVAYNPRPTGPNTAGNRFGIRTIRSRDGGRTWGDGRVVYEAGTRFEDGCWEPVTMQLPSGEVQLYFSDEGPYTTSGEQNISLMRSSDGGLTWSQTPEIVSFRPGHRDGMPVPVLLNGTHVAFSIEDNAGATFKPYIIRNALIDNWKGGPAGPDSPARRSALTPPLPDAVYAGAPYLRQLPTGETVLGCQSTENRLTNNMNVARLLVYLGDRDARQFSRPSEPFAIPPTKSGLWNSLCVLRDGSVIALTTTNGYAGNRTEVWMIRGYVIPEQTALVRSVTIDGNLADGWPTEGRPGASANSARPAVPPHRWTGPGTLPVFVGHRGHTQLRAGFARNADFLYLGATVADSTVVTDSPALTDDDGLTLALNPTNADVLNPSVIAVTVAADGRVQVRQGRGGGWVAYTTDAGGIRKAVTRRAGGYTVELAIPWAMLGGKPRSNARIGYNLSLTSDQNGGPADYIESITGSDETAPGTWSSLLLK